MSDRRPGDPRHGQPDAAALDELLRAFDIDVPADAPGADIDDDPPGDPGPGTVVDDGDDIDDIDDGDDIDDHLDATAPADADVDMDVDVDGAVGDRAGSAVISIADDELPDAVYVDGDLGRPSGRGGRGVVFIEDDDTGDALTLDAATTGSGGMEPRLRDRRDAVRRAAGRKRVRWAAGITAVVLLIVGVLAVLGSPLFSVQADQVRITGVVYTDREQLDQVVEDLVGTPVLLADTRSAEAALEQIPWVERARVRTSFPRSASIEIGERTPLATYQGPDGRFRVLDRDGRVLDVLDGQPVAYMLVTGPDPVDLEAGAFAPAGYSAAAELVQALTSTVRGRTAAVDVTSDGTLLRLFLDDGTEIRFGSANDLLVKLVRLENVLPIAEAEGAQLVDVSTAEVTLR